MRIAFLLPRWSKAPVGGYAVAYEYAKRLRARGHHTTAVHVATWTPPAGRSIAAEAVRRTQSRGHRQAPIRWRSDDIESIAVFRPPWRQLRRYDRVVATSWLSAESAARRLPHERLLYLIQSLETWSGPAARVEATWHLPIRKVVIATWLREYAAERGLSVDLVDNAVAETFSMSLAPDARPAASVVMLWHEHPVKGSDVAVEVLNMARQQRPALTATAFSVYDRPRKFPSWIGWVRRADAEQLRTLFNEHAAFLSCSRVEGWGLPSTEAMASGCALVSSDIGGVKDYAHHERTALLAPSEDVPALASQLVRLIDDDALRVRLATAGHQLIRDQFSWDRSVERLEQILCQS